MYTRNKEIRQRNFDFAIETLGATSSLISSVSHQKSLSEDEKKLLEMTKEFNNKLRKICNV